MRLIADYRLFAETIAYWFCNSFIDAIHLFGPHALARLSISIASLSSLISVARNISVN